jgi:hypothetical protein
MAICSRNFEVLIETPFCRLQSIQAVLRTPYTASDFEAGQRFLNVKCVLNLIVAHRLFSTLFEIWANLTR